LIHVIRKEINVNEQRTLENTLEKYKRSLHQTIFQTTFNMSGFEVRLLFDKKAHLFIKIELDCSIIKH
jgi:hypothetical protein